MYTDAMQHHHGSMHGETQAAAAPAMLRPLDSMREHTLLQCDWQSMRLHASCQVPTAMNKPAYGAWWSPCAFACYPVMTCRRWGTVIDCKLDHQDSCCLQPLEGASTCLHSWLSGARRLHRANKEVIESS